MGIDPRIEERRAQPYVGLRGSVTMETIGDIADQIPMLFGRLADLGLEPAGAPFLRYDLIDMKRRLVVEAGVPVTTLAPDVPADTGAVDGEMFGAVLPAGRFAVLTHRGHPDELVSVTAELLVWAADQHLDWDMTETAEGERWGCRLEVFRTNPAEVPDPAGWETDLVFRLAG